MFLECCEEFICLYDLFGVLVVFQCHFEAIPSCLDFCQGIFNFELFFSIATDVVYDISVSEEVLLNEDFINGKCRRLMIELESFSQFVPMPVPHIVLSECSNKWYHSFEVFKRSLESCCSVPFSYVGLFAEVTQSPDVVGCQVLKIVKVDIFEVNVLDGILVLPIPLFLETPNIL